MRMWARYILQNAIIGLENSAPISRSSQSSLSSSSVHYLLLSVMLTRIDIEKEREEREREVCIIHPVQCKRRRYSNSNMWMVVPTCEEDLSISVKKKKKCVFDISSQRCHDRCVLLLLLLSRGDSGRSEGGGFPWICCDLSRYVYVGIWLNDKRRRNTS